MMQPTQNNYQLDNFRFPGYGWFWVANSISSTLLGVVTRERQKEMLSQSQEFQLEIENARNITEDRKLQEEIAFKRRMMALAREQRQEQVASQYIARKALFEFGEYIDNCWPLQKETARNIITQIETMKKGIKPKLNVVLIHTPILPKLQYGEANPEDRILYNLLEYNIDIDSQAIGDVHYRKDACNKMVIVGGNAIIMNIHFLMNPLPTLVITPRYMEGRLYFDGAVWEAQAPRPFMRQLFSIDYLPGKAEIEKSYRNKMIDLIHTCISTIIGVVRDSYMLLTQYKPTTLTKWLNDENHINMKKIVMENNNIYDFIIQENQNTLAAIDSKKNSHLLEVYSKEDINNMRCQLQSNIF